MKARGFLLGVIGRIGKLIVSVLGYCPFTFTFVERGSSIGCASAWYADGRGFDPHVWQNILSWRFDHEKKSTAILSLPLIEDQGQLSITGERMCTKYW